MSSVFMRVLNKKALETNNWGALIEEIDDELYELRREIKELYEMGREIEEIKKNK